jgi:hypothetical protein
VAREAISAISHEIAFADDTDELTFLIDHRQRTDIVLRDELGCIGDAVLAADRNDVTDHYIHRSHRRVPLFYSESFAE